MLSRQDFLKKLVEENYPVPEGAVIGNCGHSCKVTVNMGVKKPENLGRLQHYVRHCSLQKNQILQVYNIVHHLPSTNLASHTPTSNLSSNRSHHPTEKFWQ